jgi:hypothetical protein
MFGLFCRESYLSFQSMMFEQVSAFASYIPTWLNGGFNNSDHALSGNNRETGGIYALYSIS